MVYLSLPPAILQVLEGLSFPASASEILRYAEEHGASEAVLAQLRAMPDHVFGSFEEMGLSLGLISEFMAAESEENAIATPAAAPNPRTVPVQGEGAMH